MSRKMFNYLGIIINEISESLENIGENLIDIVYVFDRELNLKMFCTNCCNFNVDFLFKRYCCQRCIEEEECCVDSCYHKNICRAYSNSFEKELRT